MSKSYILAIVIIGVYLIVINPITSKQKEDTKKEDKKESSKDESKKDASTGIQAENNVAGFDYSLITDEVLDNLSTNKTTTSTPTYTL